MFTDASCSESELDRCESFAYQNDDGNWLLLHRGEVIALPTPNPDGYGVWCMEIDSGDNKAALTDGVEFLSVKRRAATVKQRAATGTADFVAKASDDEVEAVVPLEGEEEEDGVQDDEFPADWF